MPVHMQRRAGNVAAHFAKQIAVVAQGTLPVAPKVRLRRRIGITGAQIDRTDLLMQRRRQFEQIGPGTTGIEIPARTQIEHQPAMAQRMVKPGIEIHFAMAVIDRRAGLRA